MCLGEMATQDDENYVRVQSHWEFWTDGQKYFHPITGLTDVPDYVCNLKNRVSVLESDNFFITLQSDEFGCLHRPLTFGFMIPCMNAFYICCPIPPLYCITLFWL